MAEPRKLWEKGEPLDPLVERFTTGDDWLLDRKLARYDVLVNLAHAAALQEARVLSPGEHDAIRGALREAWATARDARFPVEREQEDVHTALESFLVARLGDAGKKIHTARSRNDQVLTDLKLHAKEHLVLLARDACDLALELIALARRHPDVPMPGYTHLRRAMPSSVAFWAAGHAEGLLADLSLVRDAYRLNDRCPLGTGAGFGVPIRIDRELTARLLGFNRLERNAQAAQSGRGKVAAQTIMAMVQIGGDLAHLAWDLVLFTADEFGFFRLPAACTTGSSIMPQKRNPDPLELIRGNAAVLASHLHCVLGVGLHLPSSYHRDLQLTKGPLLRGFDLARDMVRVAARVVAGLEVDAERCRGAVTPEVHAAAKATRLAVAGVPFRDAYRQVAEMLREGRADELAAAAGEAAPSLGGPGDLGLDELAREIADERAWGARQLEAMREAMAGLAGEPAARIPDPEGDA